MTVLSVSGEWTLDLLLRVLAGVTVHSVAPGLSAGPIVHSPSSWIAWFVAVISHVHANLLAVTVPGAVPVGE